MLPGEYQGRKFATYELKEMTGKLLSGEIQPDEYEYMEGLASYIGLQEELTDEADKVKALRLLCMRLAPEHPRSHGDFSECRGKNGGLAHHRGTDHRKGESGKDGMKKTVP